MTVGEKAAEDLDQARAAQIIGNGIGRPVKYVEVTVAQARQGMLDAGMPRFIVDVLDELNTAVREGGADAAEPRSADPAMREFLARQAQLP